MDKQTLNKKLAEWAGFIHDHWGDELFIIYPNKKTIKPEPPDFTKSLDACFEWLVPKLRPTYWAGVSYNSFWQGRGDTYEGEVRDNNMSMRIYKIAETPALALCLAIEKLIDGEKE